MKNGHQFVFHDNKWSNCPLSLADASHEFQIHVSVRILTIKISQWAGGNFCSYRKKLNSARHGVYHLFHSITFRHWNKRSRIIELHHRKEEIHAKKFVHDNRLYTYNSIKFIHVSKDGLSISSSDNCEDSSTFLAEGTSAITLETMSVKVLLCKGWFSLALKHKHKPTFADAVRYITIIPWAQVGYEVIK